MRKLAIGWMALGLTAMVFVSPYTRADSLEVYLDGVDDADNVTPLANPTGEDTFIAYGTVSGDQGNLGNSLLYVYEERATSGQNWYGRSLLKFPLPTLPAGATINSATVALRLKEVNRVGVQVHVFVHEMLVPWEEMEATWALAKAGTPWAAPGMASGTDYVVTPLDSVICEFDNGVAPAENIYHDFDITSAVLGWYANPSSNNGLAIIAEFPTPNDAYVQFYASESYASFDPNTEPRLTIDYTVGGLAGDLNGDGFVGLDDLDIVLQNWNQNVPPADDRADPSGDGFVGLDDLDTVLNHWNEGTPPAGSAVPEPAAMGVLLAGLAASTRLRPIRR